MYGKLSRYPQDNFDRIWTSDFLFNIHDAAGVRTVSSEETISTNNTKNLPPAAVMQTACVLNGSAFPFRFGAPAGSKSLLLMYLAEIEKLKMFKRRSFYVMINGEEKKVSNHYYGAKLFYLRAIIPMQ